MIHFIQYKLDVISCYIRVTSGKNVFSLITEIYAYSSWNILCLKKNFISTIIVYRLCNNSMPHYFRYVFLPINE